MNDTTPEIAARYKKLIMSKSGEERLLMGCSMYDTARKIVLSAIRNNNPAITNTEIKRQIFLRFYGHEFQPSDKEKILAKLTYGKNRSSKDRA